MPHFEHPPIEVPQTRVYQAERTFAQRAYASLGNYADAWEDTFDEKTLWLPVTPRVDIDGESFKEDVSRVALRLIGTPSFKVDTRSIAAAIDSEGYKESDTFIIIELQYGLLAEDDLFFDDEIDDDDFSWQSYVAVIIDPKKPYHPLVIDTNTGESLDGADLMRATMMLEYLSDELESRELDTTLESMIEPPEKPELTIAGMAYGMFKTENFMPGYTCGECVTQNTPCQHNPSTLN